MFEMYKSRHLRFYLRLLAMKTIIVTSLERLLETDGEDQDQTRDHIRGTPHLVGMGPSVHSQLLAKEAIPEDLPWILSSD